MGWSTSGIARIAGVSVRTVRYYHEIGLLPVPDRAANGYKSYGVVHLARLIRIRRLVGLGFSLATIAEMDAAGPHAEQAFRLLDAELGERIRELQAARAELSDVFAHEVGSGLPPGFTTEEVPADLTEADRSLLTVLGTLLPGTAQGLRQWVLEPVGEAVDAEFDQLPVDASEAVRVDLAHRMVPAARAAREYAPNTPVSDQGSRDVGTALRDAYNAAQMDVLIRVAVELDDEPREGR